jgi:hypothetical protein
MIEQKLIKIAQLCDDALLHKEADILTDISIRVAFLGLGKAQFKGRVDGEYDPSIIDDLKSIAEESGVDIHFDDVSIKPIRASMGAHFVKARFRVTGETENVQHFKELYDPIVNRFYTRLENAWLGKSPS